MIILGIETIVLAVISSLGSYKLGRFKVIKEVELSILQEKIKLEKPFAAVYERVELEIADMEA